MTVTLETGGTTAMPEIIARKITAVGTSIARYARFLETVRALSANEDEAAFNEKLKGIAGQKPKPSVKLEES